MSRETTFIVEPLDADGLPDYVGFIEATYGRGVPATENAAAELALAVGSRLPDATLDALGVDPDRVETTVPLVGGVLKQDFDEYLDSVGVPATATLRETLHRQFLDERYVLESRGPGSSADFPVVRDWLAANRDALTAIATACQRRGWWIPPRRDVRLPHQFAAPLLPYRTAAQAFQARAMLRLGGGDWAGALEDVLVGYRLSALTRQGGFAIDSLAAGMHLDYASAALAHLASSDVLVSEQSRQQLTVLETLIDAPFAEGKDRLFALATLSWMWEVGDASAWADILEPLQSDDDDLPDGLYRVPIAAVDWDAAFESVNRVYDIAECGPLEEAPSYRGPRARGIMDRLDEPQLSELIERATHDDGEARRELAEAVVAGARLLPEDWPGKYRVYRNDSEARAALALTALALATYRAEQGSWPAELDALRPNYLRAPRSEGYEIRYENEGDGMVLFASPDLMGVTGRIILCWDGSGGLVEWYDEPIPARDGPRCPLKPDPR